MIVSGVADSPSHDQRDVTSDRRVLQHGASQRLHRFLIVHPEQRVSVDANQLIVYAQSRVLRSSSTLCDMK